MLDEVLDCLNSTYLYLPIYIRELFLDGQQDFAEGTLGILKLNGALSRTVGCGDVGLASLCKVGFHNLCHAFHKVARLLCLLLYLGCGESEVIENHGRLTAETCYDGVDHVVKRLPCLLCLELGKG